MKTDEQCSLFTVEDAGGSSYQKPNKAGEVAPPPPDVPATPPPGTFPYAQSNLRKTSPCTRIRIVWRQNNEEKETRKGGLRF